MIMWLWTDYCTVDNESLPILMICLKHSKTIEIVTLSDRLKIVIFEDVQIQFHCVFLMSISQAYEVKYGRSHRIQIKFGR